MPQSQQDCAIRLQQCAVHKAASAAQLRRFRLVGGQRKAINSVFSYIKTHPQAQCIHIRTVNQLKLVYGPFWQTNMDTETLPETTESGPLCTGCLILKRAKVNGSEG